jgi:malate dehydrogenase (oxaloacetate-decarboxylating)(NADP+)
MSDEKIRDAALAYHRQPTPGKISLAPTKGLASQHDLSMAYSPGVAYACTAIQDDPSQAASLTSRANLVGVVTNGTAVLGLGNIGPLAGKPVMEGKACLFKKFAGIDVFDIEVAETDVDKFVDIVAALEPTFGGINLEDIKAPECFAIERRLRERMNIPVFHDDQHGTAIVAAAAVLNGLKIVGKQLSEVRLVANGAGAASIACLDLLVSLGLNKANILLVDSKGVVFAGRTEQIDESKARYAAATELRTLADAVPGCDIFLGLSAPGTLKPEMLQTMADRPLVFAMANPEPEIRPELAKQIRPDCLIGTGRSDYPNQINNSLCFPFIFRGALDVGATRINEEMKLAAVHALAKLAHAESSDVVASAYGEQTPAFGPDYLIPRAFDPRLILNIAPAVAQAAMDTGVAERPLSDMDEYRRRLKRFVYQSGTTMQPVFAAAQQSLQRVAYAEGEDKRVLHAAQTAVDENFAFPIFIGRQEVIEANIAQLGLRLRAGENCEIVNVLDIPDYESIWTQYYDIAKRQGVSQSFAQEQIRSRPTLLGSMLLRRGYCDALLCGMTGIYPNHLKYVRRVIGLRPGTQTLANMQMLILPDRQLFICDTNVNVDPTAEQVAEIALLAAQEVQQFGLTPSVALLSHSSFGSADTPTAIKMRQALELIIAKNPGLAVDGEMHGDVALSTPQRNREFPDSRLVSDANLLIMPNIDAANITYNVLRVTAGNGVSVGGILLGAAKPVHIVSRSSTTRRIVNMTALAAVDAVWAKRNAQSQDS